jgi:DNA invertase Pin-like site-specific DNA recombinase
MSKARRPAISYSRFSDLIQAKGDSQDRQDRMFRLFCERHALAPLSEVFADRGRSGYKDEHRKKGRLGQLIAMAKEGHFEPGTVVVVEAWDRLGRLRPDKMTQLVAELVQTGIAIGVCRLDDIFTEDDFGTHKWTTLAVFIQLAYQESKQKAERVAASWERRREKARQDGALLSTRPPAWLECAGGVVRPIPSRAATVKRIFQLAASGYGHTRIVKALQDDGTPAFGKVRINEGRSRSQFSGSWSRPYVALILNDRRALGELQPRKLDGTPDGPPIPNYFPAVVTEEEFLLARAGQAERLGYDKKGRVLAAREARYVNTFRGMLCHARDGEGFVLHNKGTRAEPELILVNAKGNGGRDRCYTFPYFVFEEAVLGLLREVKPEDVLPKRAGRAGRVATLRAKLAAARRETSELKDDLTKQYSKVLAAVLREREAREEQIARELEEELAKEARPVAQAWDQLPSLVDLIREGGDEARLKVRPVLRRVIESAWVLIVKHRSYQLCATQVFFTGGAARSYLIVYQPAATRGPTRPSSGDARRRQRFWPDGPLGPGRLPAPVASRGTSPATALGAFRADEAD